MTEINAGRMTVSRSEPFAVFLIGMRFNRLWKVRRWWPVVTAMPRMLRELQARPELGFLGAEQYFGRTTLMIQYWNSFDQLEAYARSRDHEHLPAWAQFNRATRGNTDVGIWHETYLVMPGAYECIYVNMPAFGLGRIGPLIDATGAREGARDRMHAA